MEREEEIRILKIMVIVLTAVVLFLFGLLIMGIVAGPEQECNPATYNSVRGMMCCTDEYNCYFRYAVPYYKTIQNNTGVDIIW